MQELQYACHKISEGKGKGELIISTEDICFYLVDPATGIVIEKDHCLEGKSIAGKVLVCPSGKASSVVQADGMFQLKMKGNEPKAIILLQNDTVIIASAIINEWPMVSKVDSMFFKLAVDGDLVEIDADNERVTLFRKE